MSRAREVTERDIANISSALAYSADTGITRKSCGSRSDLLGEIAGYVDKSTGYRRVEVQGKTYYYHRLVWFFATGRLPIVHLDHINGDKSDNRIENLREVSHRQNMQNRIRHRSGRLVGSYFRKDVNKWQSECILDGTYHYLGQFDTELEAHERYLQELATIGETLIDQLPAPKGLQ